MLFDRRDSLKHRADITADLRSARPRGSWMRLLGQVLKLAEGHADLVRHGERPWASATFSGTRHTIALAFEGAAAVAAGERFIADLPEHEFNILGQLVADANVVEVTHVHVPGLRMEVEVELLLLEDI